MKRSAIPLILCLLSHLACNKVELSEMLASKETAELDKVAALRNYKQPWVDHKDQFPAIQKQLETGAIEVIWALPLKTYDPSIRMPNNNEVGLVKVESATEENKYYKVMLKPRSSSLHQKVEQGAFEIASFLNMSGLIPPTVLFNASGKNGVLSYFIDGDPHVPNPWTWKYKYSENFESIEDLLEAKSLNNFYTFAYVLGLWDLKWVNTLLVGESAPYAIVSLDNESLMSPVYAPKEEHFYVCWKQDPTYSSSPYEDLSAIEAEKFILKKEEIPNRLEDIKRFFIKDESIQKLADEEQQKEIIIKRM